MTSSRFLFYFSLFFIIGVFLSSFFYWIHFLIPVVLASGVFLITVSLLKKKLKVFLIGVFLINLTLGFFHCSDQEFFFDSKGKEKEIKGIIVREIDLKEKSTHLTVEITEINNEKVDFKRTLVVTEKYFKANYLDEVEIKGVINKPKVFNGFDYPGYLAKDGIYSNIFYPEIRVIKENSSFKKEILKIKNEAREIIHENLPSPQSFLLSAMTLGDKSRIPKNWQEKLSVSGVRHITAVSGLHITVLTIILINLFSTFGISKKKSFLFVFLITFFFVFITGMQASAIRAGIMGGGFLLSKNSGRMVNSFRLIVFIAFLMLAFNPLLLKNDIGFQLSFSAVSGIIIFFPIFKKVFSFFPEIIRDIMAISFSAHVFTFSLIGYHFNEVSLVFPITNVLIIPIIYWIMILGLGFVFFSLISGFLSAIFLIPLWMLLSYLVFVVDFFSQFSWASINFNEIFFVSFLFYIVLFFWMLSMEKEMEIR